MKTNKLIAIVLCIVMMLSVLTACGNTAKEEPIGMPNPLKEVTATEMGDATGLYLVAPDGAADAKYFTINDKTAQVVFTLDGKEYTYRAESTDKLEAYDFSGLNYTWAETTEGSVGYLTGVVETCDKAGAMYWLDVVPGIAYCLGCSTAVTADELVKVANACFVPTQGDVEGVEPDVGMPNPLREATGAQMAEATGLVLIAPSGAVNVRYFILNDKTAQLVFSLDGKEYTYRAEPTDKLEAYDFSGLNYTWAETSEEPVGYLTATVSTCDEAGVAYWLDVVPGIAYSLGCNAVVTADELVGTANACFIPTQGDVDGTEEALLKEVDTDEMAAATGLVLAAPEGAADVFYFLANGITAQVNFMMDGKEYTYRAQCTGELEAIDLSGLNDEWTSTAEGQVANLTATVKTNSSAAVAYWLDIVPGVAYTLSCGSAATADEMLALANLCYVPTQHDA